MRDYPTITLEDVKAGDIFFSGGDSFIQKAIRFFTKSIWSHSGIIGYGPQGTLCSIEALRTGVHCLPFENKIDEPDWILVVKPVATQLNKDQAFLYIFKNYVDKPYGFKSYIWFIYRSICRQFGFNPKRVWKWADDGITCTELTCADLIRVNSHLSEFEDFSGVAPQDLFEFIEIHPFHFKIRGWLKRIP